jgi:nitrite reductase/ring-hydroxylating ferredoxin subunit
MDWAPPARRGGQGAPAAVREDAVNDVTRILDHPCLISPEAYTSQAYLQAENDRLWPKVWQIACRVEEIPKVGDYITYDIVDESIIVVRSAADRIQAFYNVCRHRGRQLTQGCGHTKQFACRFHGWRWNLDGENAFILDEENWGGYLTPDNTRLKSVKVDTWGGWVWINMDPDCEPLQKYLEPASTMLGPFELEKMRYRWRQWLYFPCNWKIALEAFNESYHVSTSHPELNRYGELLSWSRAEGRHAWHGLAGIRNGPQHATAGLSGGAAGAHSADARISTPEMLEYLMAEVNATTTDTFIKAARRLVDELPPGTSHEEVSAHLVASAKRDDAARGVIWPEIDRDHLIAAGIDWHVFPNSIILPGITFALCYRARPNGRNPDSCIFEVYVLERFPEGQEPKTEWVFEPDPTEEKWRRVLSQDFQNMPYVQRGMKSRGFEGARPNPVQEKPVTNFHRNLAEYVGMGAPVELK